MTTGRNLGKTATFADYERYFKTEHLHKFSPEEVGFVEHCGMAGRGFSCSGCRHWFINQVSGWTPCEIMTRGKLPVPGGAICRFWTNDGKRYPLVDVL